MSQALLRQPHSGAAPMTTDALSGLRDIHLPETPIGWWPPAPGWWIVLGISLLGCFLVYRRWSRARRARYFHREARRLSRQYLAQYRATQNSADLLQHLFAVMRRVGGTTDAHSPLKSASARDLAEQLRAALTEKNADLADQIKTVAVEEILYDKARQSLSGKQVEALAAGLNAWLKQAARSC